MDEHVVPTYRRAEPLFTHGNGARLMDESGRSWLDFLSGIGVTALGHSHPRLVSALREQCGALTHVSNLFRHPFTDELANRLAARTGMHSVFFSNSGAEAIEAALKIARKAQKARGHEGRTHFVALEGGFHGRTLGALSITANEKYRAPFAPTLETTFCEPEDHAALQAALDTEPAALVLEPIQGEGGVRPLSAEYLNAAREACDATGTLLVHDEIQCGAGRTGRFLCGEWAGVVPDVVTLAKPLAAGMPIGATLVSKALGDVLGPGDHGSTFGGGPLALRAALVFLDELDNGLETNIQERGAQLDAGLDALADKHEGVEGRRGRGLMQGLVVPGRANDLQAALFEAGLVVCSAGPDVVRFLPPFIVTASHVDEALAIVDATLAATGSTTAVH